jgi:hypothetical protein
VDSQRAWALAAYAVLVGSLATPLYDPLSAGRDDSWALVLLLAATHLGAGLLVRRAWVLLVPAAVGVAWFALAGAEALAWVILLFGVPIFVAVTALGWLLGSLVGRYAAPLAAGAFAIALLPGAWASLERLQREPHVSAREQRGLPTMAYLLVQDLCLQGDSRRDRAYATAARRRASTQFRAIERSLRAHPDAVVDVRFDPAETHLEGAQLGGGPADAPCYRRGRARLQRMLAGGRGT